MTETRGRRQKRRIPICLRKGVPPRTRRQHNLKGTRSSSTSQVRSIHDRVQPILAAEGGVQVRSPPPLPGSASARTLGARRAFLSHRAADLPLRSLRLPIITVACSATTRAPPRQPSHRPMERASTGTPWEGEGEAALFCGLTASGVLAAGARARCWGACGRMCSWPCSRPWCWRA